MRILYGITKSNFGGAQRYVLELASEAKREGHSVSVVCGEGGALNERIAAYKIPVIPIATLDRNISVIRDLRSFVTIWRVLRATKPDVFHINSSKMGGLGAVAARIAGVPKIIFTIHGWAFNEERPLWQKRFIKFLYWVIILFSHKTICVSKQSKKDVENWLLTKDKCTVIHNGVRSFEVALREDARQRLSLGIPDNTLIVGTVAELHKIKGLDTLLKAWHRFDMASKARLIIIGSGEERQNLEALRDKLELGDSVIFKGFLDSARALLSGLDVFVLPSRSECLPYTLLEAGLAGLPVITTKVGGIPEIIEHGKSGVLVEPNNAVELTEAISRLAKDKDLRKELGSNLRTRVKKHFSFKKMVRDTIALYS